MYLKLVGLLVEDDEVGEGTARINSDVEQLMSSRRRNCVDNTLGSRVSVLNRIRTHYLNMLIGFPFQTADYNSRSDVCVFIFLIS